MPEVDLAVVFTQPDKVSSEFGKALRYEAFDRERLLGEMAGFARLLDQAAAKVPTLAALTWIPPFWAMLGGTHGWQGAYDTNRILAEGNLQLAPGGAATREPGAAGPGGSPGRYRGSGLRSKAVGDGQGYPFTGRRWKPFARQIRSLIDAVQGRSRKLIVLDLDNTLWGGIVGEDGWQNLKVGGIDPAGESYSIFQTQLKSLRSRGILLGIVSRNQEDVALEAIRRHPEMVLKAEDFAGWRINWQDKAANIAELAGELNLGLQSVVFIDDNPAERDRVRQALPEVLVPDWPADPAMYPLALKNLMCFETLHLSAEDMQRTELYAQERQRTQALGTAGSREDWLASLGMKVRIQRLNGVNLPRAAQLLNKTNQFNLSTRRLAETALADWAGQPGHRMLTFEVEDRFGGYGLVGLLGLCREGETLRIVDWAVSCRVLGRGVEETMLAAAGMLARKAGCSRIIATHVPTAKNKPILAYLEALPAAKREGSAFVLLPENCSSPDHVAMSGESEEVAVDVDADR